jgi:hypothetical protein
MAGVTRKMRKQYEEFLVEIPMLLEDLQELLDKSQAYKQVKVAFDDESLDQIESFYLDVLAGKEKISISLARMNRIIIAYFGEALIERAGGRWDLNDVEGDPAFGTPVVVDWGEGEVVAFSPVQRREILIENRQPFLREMINYSENKAQIEEDFFKEFK